MSAWRAGPVYFALVFAAGFAFGTLRVLFVVPVLGVRIAELLEMPMMAVVIVLAARYTVRRYQYWARLRPAFHTGLIALCLLLLAEWGLVLAQGLDLRDYLAARDPVAATVYALMLCVYALMPAICARLCANPETRLRTNEET